MCKLTRRNLYHFNFCSQAGPCFDWFLPGMCVNNLLVGLWRYAFSKIRCVVAQGGAEDFDFLLDVHWHAVQGARLKASLQFLPGRSTQFSMICAAIVLEPLRWLVKHFLLAGKNSGKKCAVPEMFNLVSPNFSAVVVVLQYYAALVTGRSSRLILLWSTASCKSFEEWCRKHPAEVYILRRAVLISETWIRRRIHGPATSWPWKLAVAADGRQPVAMRRGVAEDFLKSELCCLDPHAGRRLRHVSRVCNDFLISAAWSDAVHCWLRTVRLVMSSVENKHARNRQACRNSPLSWGHFAAQYVNREAMQVLSDILESKSSAMTTPQEWGVC
jgi:hypothetical protein